MARRPAVSHALTQTRRLGTRVVPVIGQAGQAGRQEEQDDAQTHGSHGAAGAGGGCSSTALASLR